MVRAHEIYRGIISVWRRRVFEQIPDTHFLIALLDPCGGTVRVDRLIDIGNIGYRHGCQVTRN